MGALESIALVATVCTVATSMYGIVFYTAYPHMKREELESLSHAFLVGGVLNIAAVVSTAIILRGDFVSAVVALAWTGYFINAFRKLVRL